MGKKTEIKSQPWWVIFLIIPILVSCTVFTPVTSIVTVSNTSVTSIGKVSNTSVTSIGIVSNTLVTSLLTVSKYLRKVVVRIGKRLSKSDLLVVIEIIIDRISRMPGYVIFDSDNPLHGTFSRTIELHNKDPRTHKIKVIKLDRPTMEWDQENSRWKLDPKYKESVLNQIDKKSV